MGLILLDLDGTLVPNAIVDVETETGTKLQRRQDELFHEPVLLPGRYDRLNQAASEGDSFAIVTNQGGVAWGYHTQAEAYQRIGCTLRQLAFFWGAPFSVHVAFMHPRATLPQFKGDDGRKPGPGLLRAAQAAHGVEPGSIGTSIMVGDREEDWEAAAAASVDFSPLEDFFAA